MNQLVKYDGDEVRSALLDLPVELLMIILESLDYPTAMKASAVCRIFNNIIKLKTRFTRNDKRALMLHAEQTFQRYVRCKIFACFKCSSFLPEYLFGSRQVSSARAKGGYAAHRRFCIRCGIVRFHYRPGQVIRLFGSSSTFRICSRCNRPNFVGSKISPCDFVWEERVCGEFSSNGDTTASREYLLMMLLYL